jgi:orotidine-5'-phosphate decarboxylase
MQAAATEDGLVLVNSSRSIIFASSEGNFAQAAGQAATALRDRLNAARPA